MTEKVILADGSTPPIGDDRANSQPVGNLPKRSLEVIGSEIESIKANARGMFAACEAYAQHSCFEIGKRLLEAKECVEHGQYLPWLESHGYSNQTANNLIRIYTEMGNDEAFKALSYTQMVELLPLAPEKRKEILPEVEEKSKREINRLVKELKAAEEAQKKAEEAQKEAEKARADAEGLLANRDKQIEKLHKENADNFAAKTTAEADLKQAKKDLNQKLKEATQMISSATESEKKKDARIKELEEQMKHKEKRDLTESELASIYRAAEKEVAAKQAKAEAQADPLLVELNVLLKDIQNHIYRVSELLGDLPSNKREDMVVKVSGLIHSILNENGIA